MNPKRPEAHDEKPFVGMHINLSTALHALQGRCACSVCHKSRKYFCYTCYVPVPALSKCIPEIRLPIKIDIIKHQSEIDGKSTAIHAAVLAPQDVKIYTYPDIPTYDPKERTVLVYPSAQASDISSLFTKSWDEVLECNRTSVKNELDRIKGHHKPTLLSKTDVSNEQKTHHVKTLPIDRAVFIDSTWNQSKGIYKDDRISRIPAVVIQSRASQFWRHQKNSPRWYLSTVEAIHQLLVELHVRAWGRDARYEGTTYPCTSAHLGLDDCIPYNGHYDNLLFFFKHMYEKIHTLYDHDRLLAYKRPMS